MTPGERLQMLRAGDAIRLPRGVVIRGVRWRALAVVTPVGVDAWTKVTNENLTQNL
jgi:hypothetical protein